MSLGEAQTLFEMDVHAPATNEASPAPVALAEPMDAHGPAELFLGGTDVTLEQQAQPQREEQHQQHEELPALDQEESESWEESTNFASSSSEQQPPSRPALVLNTGNFDAAYQIVGGVGSDSLQTSRGATACFCVRRSDGMWCVAKKMAHTAQTLRDVTAMYECGNHPNICPVVEVFATTLLPGHALLPYDSVTEFGPHEVLILVMPRMLCDLYTLMVNSPALMTDSVVKSIARQMLTAVARVEECGYVNCDIKPENFLIVSLDPIQLCLTDFGHVVRINEQPPFNFGTLGYQAPETLASFVHAARHGVQFPVTAKVDVWAVGVALHTMLVLALPYGPGHKDSMACTNDIKVPDCVLLRLNNLPHTPRVKQHLITSRPGPHTPSLCALIDACLTGPADQRPSALQALAMPFLQG